MKLASKYRCTQGIYPGRTMYIHIYKEINGFVTGWEKTWDIWTKKI